MRYTCHRCSKIWSRPASNKRTVDNCRSCGKTAVGVLEKGEDGNLLSYRREAEASFTDYYETHRLQFGRSPLLKDADDKTIRLEAEKDELLERARMVKNAGNKMPYFSAKMIEYRIYQREGWLRTAREDLQSEDAKRKAS